VRVLEPMTLDFPALADGVRRNNVGVSGITVQVRARVERDGDGNSGGGDAVVVIEPDGQRLPLEGAAPEDGASRWRTFDVRGWDPPDTVRLTWRRDAPSPGGRP
jgi:hypothetical protein